VSQPVNLVNLEGAHLAYGTRTLLDGVSLGVAVGERIGVVGRNGAGKSTLLEVLALRRRPDGGRVTHAGGLTVGMLAQTDTLDPHGTVRHAVVGDRADHVWRSDPRARAVVDHLLAGIDLDAVVGPLSGGERRRVALAHLLVADPVLLLLDEPTNHLDVEGVDWLARHLAGRRGGLVAVTHDRWFLDAVCERTWEVVDGQVDSYDGGYAAYVLAKAERARQAVASEDRRQNLLRKELAWLRRGPPARTSKPRFRVEAANELIANEPPPRDSVELVRFAGARLGRSVYDAEDVDLTLGGRRLLASMTWRLGPGDRVGVVGVNGAGKSSLLRLLVGAVTPDSGAIKVGQTVQAGYLSQEVGELPADRRALEALAWAGNVRAAVLLGEGLRAGRLEGSPARGVAWLRRAAESGDCTGAKLLGRSLLAGGAAGEAAEGRVWLERAARAGDAGAAYSLALALRSGTGGPRDASGAVPWLEQAARGGIPQADFVLANAYRAGEGVPQDDASARRHYEAAAEVEEPGALQALAQAYRSGELGLAANAEKAQALMRELEHAVHEPVPVP